MQQFARAEFERGLEGLTDEDARFRVEKADGSQMNSISWAICHLSHQEWLFFVRGPGGPENAKHAPFATGAPACVPSLAEALEIWHEARTEADKWLLQVTDEELAKRTPVWFENQGTALMRNTGHYWFHAGEVNAIRQVLGHPEIIFVGQMLGRLEYPLA
jgi:uncharacterized damage-inducible protein DinB